MQRQRRNLKWQQKKANISGLKEGRAQGLIEGQQKGIQAVVELLQEMGLKKEAICGKIQEKFQLSSDEAAQEVEKYWM